MIYKDVIRKNFSDYARRYDMYSGVQDSCGLKLINSIEMEEVFDILDIGCGTGTFTGLLRDRFPYARIKALDMSPEMIHVAREKSVCRGVDFIVADAEKLCLENRFDLIGSNVSFQWFEDLGKVLAFYERLLREGGAIAFSMFGPRTFFELNYCLREVCAKDVFTVSEGFMRRCNLEKILEHIFVKTSVFECVIKEEFLSLLDLLRKIKYTGTRGKGVLRRGFWTPRLVDKLEKVYNDKFGGVTVTYQVFFCRAVKRSGRS